MIEYVRTTLVNQYEAALSMLNLCIVACPAEHWECRIANGSFRWVIYHTLFFTDLYLSPSNESFQLRELHERGGDEREDKMCTGLEKEEALDYVLVCRQKAIESVAAETAESLQGPSGFFWYEITRGEIHLVNIRHLQHHTGQLSAYLRRLGETVVPREAARWVGSGWHP